MSEAVSFLLLFSILLSVSITGAVFGIESLDTASQGETSVSAHRSLEAVRADMYDLSDGAAYRSTDLRMAGGSLQYAPVISITVTAAAGEQTMEPVTIHPVPIVSNVGSTEFLFVSGAIVRHQPDGGILKTGPRFRIETEQSILPLLNTSHGDGPTSVGGTGRSSLVSYRGSEETRRFEPVGPTGLPLLATVMVSVVSPWPSIWEQYFDSDPRYEMVAVDEMASTVTAEFRTKRVFVRATNVEVRFDE